MPRFSSDGVDIAYDDAGSGPPVLLIHGFASNARVNWRDTGWHRTLAGRRIIAIDNRGHGESEKLYDPAAYGAETMAEDARRLLDHLGIGQTPVMGYSMGARVGTVLAILHPARVERLVIGGMAAHLMRGLDDAESIAAGLEAEALSAVTEPAPRAFRLFAEQTRSNRRALAACMRAGRRPISAAELRGLVCPVLVVVGDGDSIAGPLAPLLDLLADGRGVTLPGRNHMNAVGDAGYKAAVAKFLSD